MTLQTPLIAQAICGTCPRVALGTGSDGKPYCHICRDWKAERHARQSKLLEEKR